MKNIILTILFTLFSLNIYAENNVYPKELEQWKNWVLDGYEEKLCPEDPISNINICNWKTELILTKSENKIKFSQEIFVNIDKKIKIPGDENYIIDFVIATNKETKKVDKIETIYINNQPYIEIKQGYYKLQGILESKKESNELKVPESISSVLIMEGDNKNIRLADIKNNTVYWYNLKDYEKKDNKNINNTENITVYREILDGIPLRVNTYIKVISTGEERVLDIENILLKDFSNIKYYANLPINIDQKEKSLKVLLKPGEHIIKIESISDYSVPEEIEPSLNDTIWFFSENNLIRDVSILGGKRIDPNQLESVPFSTINKKAFIINKDEKIQFKNKKEGYQENKNNKINVKRDLWLSFDSSKLYFKDSIKTENLSRIDYKNSNEIGKVIINNNPGYISLKGDTRGFEIRNNSVNIETEGLVDQKITNELYSTGLNLDVDSYKMSLHLPPGWSLFKVVGEGTSYQSYYSKWKLIDFFFVLLIVVIIFKKFGVLPSIITITSLIFIYHNKYFSPLFLINILIAAILYDLSKKYMENKYGKGFISLYSWTSFSIFMAMFITFTFMTTKTTLYPDLEHRGFVKKNYTEELSTMDMKDSIEVDFMQKSKRVVERGYDVTGYNINSSVSNRKLINIDENLKTQTGYGVPDISWNTYNINWNSKVSKENKIKFILISPYIQKIINIFCILSWLYLLYLLLNLKTGYSINIKNWRNKNDK